MPKFFVRTNQIENDTITMTGEDVNHIIHVLRSKKGDKLSICNGDTGENYLTKIEMIEKEYVTCKIEEKMVSDTETKTQITVFQGLPKADKMELIIQKATEIGVKEIVPVNMKRCIVKLEQKEEKKKIDRWQKIAETAAKQSMRDYIPIIKNTIGIKELKEAVEQHDLFLIAYENEKDLTLKTVLKESILPQNAKIGILIGPEGGIDIEEIKELKQENVHIITLGNRILRTETASLVIASMIIYELE